MSLNKPKETILIYGRTNSGKSASVGELAEYVYKKWKKKTRLASADRGGVETIRPYINLGVIELVELGESNPWVFLNKVVRGYVRDSNGKWVPGKNDNIGLFAFESLRSIAESLMGWMAIKGGEGVNIGGGSNISFQVQGDGETLKVSGNNPAHYGTAQARMMEELWESMKLSAEYILWTSSVSKDEDSTSAGKVLGPDVVGKALTAEIPRQFSKTFRIDVLPAQGGKPERHILYLGNHLDLGAGNAAGLGNTRSPLDAPPLPSLTVEPASIVKALEMLEGGTDKATEIIRKRMGLS